MTSRKLGGLFLAGFLAFVTPAGAQDYIGMSVEDKQKLMEEYYTRAIQYYNDGNYARAIHHWQEILKIDSEQTAPPALIKQARAKLSERLGPLEKAVQQEITAGQYESALEKCIELLEQDPGNPSHKALKEKLSSVVEFRGSETGPGKVPRLIRKGVAAHLAPDENPKTALNALRYAQDLAPRDKSLQKLVSYVAGRYPDVAKKEEAAPGMSLVEHKLFIALNSIYEGRYDLAIFACNEVLDLEPENVLALKRKGSAYFALNQKDRAREIWQEALKLSPNDSEIKKFLASK
jgi:tetratricopeptide (TPR) repeat protein